MAPLCHGRFHPLLRRCHRVGTVGLPGGRQFHRMLRAEHFFGCDPEHRQGFRIAGEKATFIEHHDGIASSLVERAKALLAVGQCGGPIEDQPLQFLAPAEDRTNHDDQRGREQQPCQAGQPTCPRRVKPHKIRPRVSGYGKGLAKGKDGAGHGRPRDRGVVGIAGRSDGLGRGILAQEEKFHRRKFVRVRSLEQIFHPQHCQHKAAQTLGFTAVKDGAVDQHPLLISRLLPQGDGVSGAR